jgi:hypothetical protein
MALRHHSFFHSMPIDTLSAGQRDEVLRLFGPHTDAGRQLRKIFGISQQTASKRVNYPPILRKDDSLSVPDTNASAVPRPSYRRRYRRKVEETVCSSRPGRRPANRIFENNSNWIPLPVPDPGKDLSGEKFKLQEAFKFSDPKVTPPSNEEIKKVFSSKPEKQGRENDIVSILQDVCEAQKSLDSLKTKPGSGTDRLKLENRIKSGLRELALLSN